MIAYFDKYFKKCPKSPRFTVYTSLRKSTFDLRPGGSSVIYHSTQLDEIGKCLYVCVYVCMCVTQFC